MSEALVTIETPQGNLAGTIVGDGEDAVHVFKGIPYALPPVGARRWKPAEPVPAWRGTRLATAFGPTALQPPPAPEDFLWYSGPSAPESEDCLYLNVWTPARPERTGLPVMVWIHGGGFVGGSGAAPVYDGAELARKGVVVVTINYRLGIFGYFCHPELSAESPHGVSGNYGTTDQIQALRWVRDNIAAYGGDADNVTIFGESAGAFAVSHLMASPLAKGLFHKGIGGLS